MTYRKLLPDRRALFLFRLCSGLIGEERGERKEGRKEREEGTGKRVEERGKGGEERGRGERG